MISTLCFSRAFHAKPLYAFRPVISTRQASISLHSIRTMVASFGPFVDCAKHLDSQLERRVMPLARSRYPRTSTGVSD